MFVLSVSKIDVEVLDLELLLYYIFKVGLFYYGVRCLLIGPFIERHVFDQ